jgi:Fe-S-cluster containining protein
MMDREQHLIQIVEAAFAEAQRRAGAWLVCGPGCGECCHRPFPITAVDAQRLHNGLAQAPPALAADIRERAQAAWSRMAHDFPGSWDDGSLTTDEAWREWFFTRLTGVPCPILDLDTQACRLYEHRPIACRLAGPAIQAGHGVFPPCHKNYTGATPAQVEACQVVLDDPLFFEPSEEPETVIAYVCK